MGKCEELERRVLICGDRYWTDKNMINFNILLFKPYLEIIEGEAPGADTCAKELAKFHKIIYHPFPANWKKYGRAAGPIRNQQMLDEGKPTLVLAFHDNIQESKGTKDMINRAVKAGIETFLFSHTNPIGIQIKEAID